MNSLGHSEIGRWGWVPGAVVVLLMVLFVFGRIANHQFLYWDDRVNVWNNEAFNPVGVGKVAHFWTHSYARMYAPLSYTFFAAEALVSGRGEAPPGKPFGPLKPTVFHLGSLLLHAACGVMVLLILRRLFHNEVAALAGALLFVLHPIQVESVAWITETRGLLAALLGLIALWQYLQYADDSNEDLGRKAVHYLVASLAMFLALLAKPSAVVVPLIALAIDWGLYRRPLQQVVAGLVPWVLLAMIISIGTAMVQEASFVDAGPLWARPLLALDAMAYYMVKIVWPVGLGPDYGHSPNHAMGQGMWYIMGVLPAALVFLAWSLPNRRVWLTALGVFAVALLPTLGLIPFDFQKNSTVADRYAYLAMLGPAMALTWFLLRYGSVVRYAAVAVVLVVLSAASFWQAGHWANDYTLALQALRVNEDSATFQLNGGNALYRSALFEEALPYYQRAYELRKDSDILTDRLVPLYNMARAEFKLGNMEGVFENIEPVIAEVPGFDAGNAYVLFGQALLRSGKNAEAREAFEKALELNPNSDGALNGLAKLDTLERT